MFDRMIYNIVINVEKEAAQIAEKNSLERWQNGAKTEYKSPKSANFEGIIISIKGNKLQIKCSLHKVYFRQTYGVLDNSGLFSITNAKKALDLLFDYVGIEKERAKITYFEIGLNLPVTFEPLQYIELMQSITAGKTDKEKMLFIDANFRKNRQKTTEKHKTIKKVFKVYDKEFENADRRHEKPNGTHILRIETMYRRQNISVADFFSKDNINRLLAVFYKDWQRVEFARNITAEKGTRTGQIENAKKVLLYGCENYLQTAKTDFEKKLLTEKQYRTIREFVNSWKHNKHKYRMLQTEHETEYRKILLQRFEMAKH
jgi:hypothetical protein